MSRSNTAIVLMLPLAVLLAGVLWYAPRIAPPGDRLARRPGELVAASEPGLVRSVEGGAQHGGYIDGRPVPSGFSMPVIIRWRQPEEVAPAGQHQAPSPAPSPDVVIP